MATGGTIPTNRTQSVTFYNTSGIIEREKNIYYVPRFSKTGASAGQYVRDAWRSAFNSVVSSSPNYSNINIASWSPEDRTLVIQGNIDDFRLVSDEGNCLNYFILSRTVTKSYSKTYYYAFFITGVAQLGGSSIQITCVPDDFTNVFYLHNEHGLTATEIANDYEPFNEVMKNCYVNRQHYDRVTKVNGRRYFEGTYDLTIDSHYSASVRIYECLQGEQLSDLISQIQYVSGWEQGMTARVEIVTRTGYEGLYLFVDGVTINRQVTIQVNASVVSSEVHVNSPANMKVFLNQTESFKYKYQFKDRKYPYRLTYEEYQDVLAEDDFLQLEIPLRQKIILSCINYLVVETKSIEMVVHYSYWHVFKETPSATEWTTKTCNKKVRNGNQITDGFNRPNVVISYPFFDIPYIFKKYESEINQYIFKGYMSDMDLSLGFTTASDVFDILNNKSVAEYIYSAYSVRDMLIPDEMINIDLVNKQVIYNVTTPDIVIPTTSTPTTAKATFVNNLYFAGLSNDPTYVTDPYSILHKITIQWGATTNPNYKGLSSTGCALGIAVSGYESKDITFSITESIPDLRSNYFDNVLETEPYAFHSLSYLSNELVFNKNRYFTGNESEVKVNYYLSVNGAVKVGIIPDYTVESYGTLYFNEGLIFTIDSAFPLVSDSYSAYYYQNKAQMKNQFAVNDYNRKTDLLQHVFVSGPNAVGMRAGKMGGPGALLETGNQVMQMVDEGIDWAQSNKVIEMNQQAKLADVGTKPDSIKQTGSDCLFDLSTNENNYYLNHYRIDQLSYNSIAKLLERSGYQVNLYDTLHVVDRVGWNFIKLNGFDFVGTKIMTSQEDSIRKIFQNGVTLLHDKTYLTSGHNYETILEGGD